MRFQIHDVSFALADARTRLPFRFGVSTLTAAPVLTARVDVRGEGTEASGYAADLLVPKWFEKDPAKSVEDDVRALLDSARAAASALLRPRDDDTAFGHWYSLYRERVLARHREAPDALVRGFGAALLERAMIDAVCRATGVSFFEALATDRLGFEGGRIYPEVKDLDLAPLGAPAERLAVRHTIGLLDPLRAAELDGDGDGLPRALEEDIARYGLTRFKLKVAGHEEADVARVVEVARVVREQVGDDARFSLDGNEQFEDLDGLARLLDGAVADDDGRWLLERVLWIEQPLRRDLTFDRDRHRALDVVTAVAPLTIDEADTGFDSFRTAFSVGYRGVSVKNCKGVFRALVNRGLCEHYGDEAFLTAEDLTNLPVTALHQDLATMAALGLTSVERNGHHYFRGLDHLPPEEAEAALAAHPDLYVRDGSAVRLRIEGGELSVASLAAAGYGTSLTPSLDARTPIDEWALRA